MAQKQLGNSGVVIMNPNVTSLVNAFNVYDHIIDTSAIGKGLTGFFQPSWSPDGNSIVVGLGSWLQSCATCAGMLWRLNANGSSAERLALTNDATHLHRLRRGVRPGGGTSKL